MTNYWVASHISGLFAIYDENIDPLKRGSRGAGFSISRGTTTAVRFSEDNENHFFFNEKEVEVNLANISNFVLNHYLKLAQTYNEGDFGVSIHHEFEIPLSAGYGASASGALSCSFALNDLLNLNLSEQKIFQIAHAAEIVEGGGLGDVLGLYKGGWEYRTLEGAPFIGKAESIPSNQFKVATLSFGEMNTKSIIKNTNWKEKINSVGNLFLQEIINEPTIRNFGLASKQFAVSSMLATPNVIEFMNRNDNENLIIGQIMLGDGIFILYKDSDDLPDHPNLVKEIICHSTVKKL
ncbi:MAG: GHMP family kinase ATP-binding protein [Candidatus Heimdallarchaeaceae archaeon]